jgi:hypothetical protein
MLFRFSSLLHRADLPMKVIDFLPPLTLFVFRLQRFLGFLDASEILETTNGGESGASCEGRQETQILSARSF